MGLLSELKTKAKKLNKRIVFPEPEDIRVLKAVSILATKKLVIPIILGNRKKIESDAKKHKIDLTGVEIENPNREKYFTALVQARKHKGMTPLKAKKLLEENIYYGVMMVREGAADGMVGGSIHPTANILRPAFQLLRTETIASSHMLITHKDKSFLFADCAVVVSPNAEELAQIAISTAKSAKFYGFKPSIAMLSYSTKGSATQGEAELVAKATAIVKKRMPKLKIDGEMQADAALVAEVAEIKAPGLKVKGDANILIFPELGAGNIGYKLVQRFSGASSVGPILQGLKKPVNDLSRGCDVEDIIMVSIITALQAEEKN